MITVSILIIDYCYTRIYACMHHACMHAYMRAYIYMHTYLYMLQGISKLIKYIYLLDSFCDGGPSILDPYGVPVQNKKTFLRAAEIFSIHCLFSWVAGLDGDIQSSTVLAYTAATQEPEPSLATVCDIHDT